MDFRDIAYPQLPSSGSMRTIQIVTAAFAASIIPLASAGDPVNNHVNNELTQYDKVVPPPGPVQPGALVDKCGGWVQATPGMTCYSLTESLGVDDWWLKAHNPQLKGDCLARAKPNVHPNPHPKITDPPPPPRKSPDADCKGAFLDQCASAVFTASETPGPMIDWCKRYLGGPTCTERYPEDIFSSYDKFPKQAAASSLCVLSEADRELERLNIGVRTKLVAMVGNKILSIYKYSQGGALHTHHRSEVHQIGNVTHETNDAFILSKSSMYIRSPGMMSHTAHSSRTSSPPADLRPAPLRIPIRKTVAGPYDNPATAVNGYRPGARDISTSTLSRERLSQHPQSDITRTLPHRRHLGPKLHSLKSQFEILHAVNSADTGVPQHPTSSYKAQPSTIPRAAKPEQSFRRSLLTPSPIESTSRGSSELSPRQIRTPAAPSRRSMLPVSTQPIAKIANGTTRGRLGGNRKSPCPRIVDNIDMGTNEQQTSRPSTSYFTSHSTVSSTDQRPAYDLSPVANRRKLFERNSSHSPCAASTIPVLRHARAFITSRGASSHRLPKSKSFRDNSPSLQQSSSAIVIFPHPETESSLKKATPGNQGTPPKTGEGLKVPALSNIARPQQRLSVADLRKSFEKFSQPVKASEGSAGSSLQPKASRHSIRQNQETSPSTSSKLRVELLTERSFMSPDASRLRPPIIGRGQIVDVRPRTKATEKISPPNPVGGPVRHGTSPYLPRSRRFELQAARQEKTKVSREPVESEPLSQPANEKMSQEWGSGNDLRNSMDGLSGVSFSDQLSNIVLMETPKIQSERFVMEGTPGIGPLGILRSPKVLSLGSRPTQGSGKVSRLRKFFESPSRFSSPLSLMNFRSKLGLEESAGKLKGDNPSSSWNEAGSPTSTHTVTRRHSIVPSLTTEISVNDFYCDFVGSPNCGETPCPASPSDTAAGMASHMKRESPVKHRILQFERISRETLNAGATSDYHGKGNDTGVSSVFKTETKRNGKHYMVGGWKPLHQKGTAIWRRISNSFGRSLDSWKDCDGDQEHLNPTEGMDSDTDFDRSPSLANCPRHRSGSFRYSMDHVSHTSPQFVSSSQTASSMQPSVGNSLNTQLKRTLNANDDCLSPDNSLPPQIIRKRLRLRLSSGFRWPNEFGLDGHFPSKPVREEEPQPSDSRTSGPSTPQGDPNALLKVMLKQSAAERSRRRQDEKHLHLRHDIKSRTLARLKGKSKADVDLHSADVNEEASKKQDKGKGKEKVGKQENETNKKTESGFVVFESKDVKLRHPKPRRPGQVRKLANMYRDKGSSGVSVNTKASSGATLKESRLSFRQKASSAFGLRGRKGSQAG
ncbi:hypothetical protein CHU98_g1176 [Xylaria longipes]|nr:hypothetical protein CHU98_g1176 [Xylaria longipes]